MKSTKITPEIIDKLEEFSRLDGTERGEMWRSLLYLYDYDYLLDKDFSISLEKFILQEYERINREFEIVEEEVKVIKEKRKVLKPKF